MQDRALTYYNGLLHEFTELPDNRRPRALTLALVRLVERNSQLFPERPDFASMRVVGANRNDPDTARRLEALSNLQPTCPSSSRLITVPDDLHIIAEAGILASHWTTLIGRIIGTYTTVYDVPDAYQSSSAGTRTLSQHYEDSSDSDA
jgi:hypothetical protein